MRRLSLLFLLTGCAPPSAFERMERLERDVRLALAREAGETTPSVWVSRFDGREILAINPDRPVPGASTLKLLLLVEAYAQADAGALSWAGETTLLAEDVVGGPGSLQREKPGSSWTWRQIARRMILESDNTAANLMLGKLGMSKVNARAASLGLAVTRFERKFMDFDALREGRENRTTAREMGRLALAIARREILTPAACDEMIALLESGARRVKHVPSARKTGSARGTRGEVGWSRVPGQPYALAIFLDNVYEKPGATEDRGALAIDTVARLVYGALGPSDE
jgi:beta-lactamase class A